MSELEIFLDWITLGGNLQDGQTYISFAWERFTANNNTCPAGSILSREPSSNVITVMEFHGVSGEIQ